MRLLFAICFGAALGVMLLIPSSPVEAKPTTDPNKTYHMMMVCHSNVTKAIKALETKLDNLIGLVNNLSTSPPPGIKRKRLLFSMLFSVFEQYVIISS